MPSLFFQNAGAEEIPKIQDSEDKFFYYNKLSIYFEKVGANFGKKS